MRKYISIWMTMCAVVLCVAGLKLSENLTEGTDRQINSLDSTFISGDESGTYQGNTSKLSGELNTEQAETGMRKVAGRLISVLGGEVYAQIASGVSGTCSFVIDDNGVLTIRPTNGVSGTLASCMATSWSGTSVSSPFPWYTNRRKVKKVVVEPGVKTAAGVNYMFYGMSNCTEMNLSGLDTSNMTSASNMFESCSGLTSLDISGFNTSNVTNMSSMFKNCTDLTSLDISGFDTSKVEDMNGMFQGCTGLTILDVSRFETSKVTDMGYMFYNCSGLTSLDVTNFNTGNVSNMQSIFFKCSKLTNLDVSGFDTSKVANMYGMFDSCSNLTSLDVSDFDTSNVTNMGSMFYNCSGLTNLDVSGLDTSNVTTMNSMFKNCSGLTNLDVSGFDTSNVKYMGSMFAGCSGLTNLDVSGFDTSKVISMYNMFGGCSGLTNLDVSGFDTSNVTDMTGMFSGCSGLTSLDLSGFDTSKVTNMQRMFYNCSGLKTLDLSGQFNMSKVTSRSSMFSGCTSLNTVYFSYNVNLKDTSFPAPPVGTPDMPVTVEINGINSTVKQYQDAASSTLYGKWTKQYPQNHSGQKTTNELIALSQSSDAADKELLSAGDNHSAWFWELDGFPTNMQAYTSKSDNWTTTRSGTSNGNTPEQFANTTGTMIDAGYWEALSADTWQYTFYVLDENTDWHVYEERIAGYHGTDEAGHNIMGISNSQVIHKENLVTTIINTSTSIPTEYGSLSIKKFVTNTSDEDIPDDTQFHFTVTLTNTEGAALTGTKVFGNTVFRNGKAGVSVGKDDTLTITDIPAGYHYTVEESDYKDYATVKSGETGIITANGTQTASFTNKKDVPTDFVDVNIAKQIDGRYEISNETYQFSATLSGLTALTTYQLSDGTSFTSDSEGNAFVEFSLAANESITIQQIPVGAKYSITEQGGNYAPAFTITNATAAGSIYIDERSSNEWTSLSTATETAELDEQTTITFTNTLNHTVPLHLTKQVVYPTGYTPSESAEFEIQAHFDNLPAGYRMTTSAGTFTADDTGHLDITFYVKEGKTVDIDAVPVLATYSFEEPEVKGYTASYTVTDTNEQNKIAGTDGTNDKQNTALSTAMETANEGEDVTVQFTNTVPSLFIEKSVTDATGEPVDKDTQTIDKGTMLMYTLTVTNAGSTPITTTVVDPLPDDVTFVEASDGGTLRSDAFEFDGTTYTGRNIVWSDITVPANSFKQLTIKVQHN